MRRPFRISLACALVVVALPMAATGSDAQVPTASAIAPTSSANALPGPLIGAHIPEFAATDQEGKSRTFASIRGPKGAVIYFHRSADWCIYCKMQLIELEASRPASARNGYGLVAISFDTPGALKEFAAEHALGFPLLSDTGSQIIRRFGLLDPAVTQDSPAYGVPVHGSLLVDATGVVRARYFDTGQGHAAGVVLMRLFTSAYNTHERVVTHDHVKLRYSASQLATKPGDQLELALEITPRQGAVVYAEDVAGTRVALTWEMEPSDAFDSGTVAYPAAVEMRIAGKPVHMYRDPVSVVRPVLITTDARKLAAAADPSGDLVLNGALKFQSCVADQCYSGRTIPLRWKVQLSPAN